MYDTRHVGLLFASSFLPPPELGVLYYKTTQRLNFQSLDSDTGCKCKTLTLALELVEFVGQVH